MPQQNKSLAEAVGPILAELELLVLRLKVELSKHDERLARESRGRVP